MLFRSVNAVALAHGWAQASDPSDAAARQGARNTLRRIWEGVIALGSLGSMQEGLMRLLTGGFPLEQAPTNLFAEAMSHWVSPYQANPLDFNPLRRLLEREIDFAAIADLATPKVFVSATHVKTGKAEIFHGKRLTAQAVMASSCLPMVFQAVEIEGEPYWDGGYSGNPALTPLIDH